MSKDRTPEEMEKRYARLTARLAKLGPVLQGTITQRTIVRQAPQRPDQTKEYGPYYQWTFKKDSKTVTVNLAPRQATVYQRAIDNHRKLEAILQEMRELSLTILDSTTQGVEKRKRPNANDLHLK